MTDRAPEQIRTQFERLRALTRSAELSARKERISAWCLAEQIDHIVKVSASVVDVLADRNAAPVGGGLNLLGWLVLRLGWIPRGAGRSPRRFRAEMTTTAELDARIAQLERSFAALPFDQLRASRVAVVPHPKFRALTPPQALRFLVVHTQHHLKIIDDILRT